ncbi:hypothetical protein A5780_26645 [Nocardia sp. 852002-20019_SCH5090214]|uniref:hypothetical protein n=1 Tax=Nocardia sp. 852002-20019_SCH5090214 TaxID=1834087 RepID=UPI0007EA43E1|nr:hypothetical protein [Nocardia sp. 852002-20019_SCH5090214]OBA53418.1 hypothetical protein A5780_26645 [Nocardia sp. 852002-20019_SCH5090214]
MGRLRRAPGFVRVLGVLTLLIGVAVMHAVVFSTGHAMAAAVEPAVASPAVANSLAAPGISPMPHGSHFPAVTAPGGVAAAARNEQAPAADRSQAAPMRTAAIADGSDCDGCTTHAGMHACVFVLVTLALALGLAVIAWLGAARILGAGRLARFRLRRRTRPPPWTVLSLAELAILRI